MCRISHRQHSEDKNKYRQGSENDEPEYIGPSWNVGHDMGQLQPDQNIPRAFQADNCG